jgi:FhaA, N-terminal domain/FHA domain
MGLQRFERRLERMVEGAFNKTFRSGLQPLEIGRRVVHEMDAGRTLGIRGPVVPNEFTVVLPGEDAARFETFLDALGRELEEAAREHARDERYGFVGPVKIAFSTDTHRHRGDFDVIAAIVEGPGGSAATLVLPDGRRLALGNEPLRIGRLPDCLISLSDPQVSRHHAEVRPSHLGYEVVDLGSTNGTLVNGSLVKERELHDGDVIMVGATSIRYEES